jgi:hypothetical protein
MRYKFKKSRIKQIILEEYDRVNEGDFDPVGGGDDWSVDDLLGKMSKPKKPTAAEKAAAERKKKDLEAQSEQFLFGLYKVAEEMYKTSLEQTKGHPNAEKIADQERKKLLQNFLDVIGAIERGEKIDFEEPI